MPTYESDRNTSWENTYQGRSHIKVDGTYFSWNRSTGNYTEYTNKVGDDYNKEDSDFQDMTGTLTTSDYTNRTTEAGTSLTEGGGISGYTYTGGKFDPTTQEFAESAKEGSFTYLLQGYGIGEDYWHYFDKPDLEQYDLIESSFDLKGKKISTDTATALGEVKEQGEQLIRKMDFATGTQPAIQKATGGVWGEYMSQKDSLDLDQKSSLKAFWEDEETAFYDRLDETEAMIDG